MSTLMPLPPTISPTVYRLLPNDPFLRDVKRLRAKIAKRAYQLYMASGYISGQEVENWLAAEKELLAPVSVEVVDHRYELNVKAHFHGFDHDDVEIYSEARRVYIRASHQDEIVLMP